MGPLLTISACRSKVARARPARPAGARIRHRRQSRRASRSGAPARRPAPASRLQLPGAEPAGGARLRLLPRNSGRSRPAPGSTAVRLLRGQGRGGDVGTSACVGAELHSGGGGGAPDRSKSSPVAEREPAPSLLQVRRPICHRFSYPVTQNIERDWEGGSVSKDRAFRSIGRGACQRGRERGRGGVGWVGRRKRGKQKGYRANRLEVATGRRADWRRVTTGGLITRYRGGGGRGGRMRG